MGIAYGKGWGSGQVRSKVPSSEGVYLIDFNGNYYTLDEADYFLGNNGIWQLFGVAVIDSRAPFVIPVSVTTYGGTVTQLLGYSVGVFCPGGVIPNVTYDDESAAVRDYKGLTNTDLIIEYSNGLGVTAQGPTIAKGVVADVRFPKKYRDAGTVKTYVLSLGELMIIRERWTEIKTAFSAVGVSSNILEGVRIVTSTLAGNYSIWTGGVMTNYAISSASSRTNLPGGSYRVLTLATIPDWSKGK